MCQVVGNIYGGVAQGWINDEFNQAASFPYHAYYLWGSGSCLSSYNVGIDHKVMDIHSYVTDYHRMVTGAVMVVRTTTTTTAAADRAQPGDFPICYTLNAETRMICADMIACLDSYVLGEGGSRVWYGGKLQKEVQSADVCIS